MAAKKKKAGARAKPAAKKASSSKKKAQKAKASARQKKAAPARKKAAAKASASSGKAPAVIIRRPEVAILSAQRTGLGRSGRGSLRDTRPDSYAASTVKAAVIGSGLSAEQFGDLVLGCAMPEAEQGMNMARIVGVSAGLPDTVPGMTINRFCSSGLEAVATVADRILAGRYLAGLAGGVESMSLVPMGGHRPSASPDLMEHQPAVYTPMGITAENVARRFNVTRAEQDAFAFRSHQRAVAALEAGRFTAETVPVTARVVSEDGSVKLVSFATDEGPRKDTTVEALAKLKPVFDKEGSVTAGNSSQTTDGAATVALADADWARKNGARVRAILRGYAVVGVPPDIMGIGPVPAIRALLQQAGLKLNDIDLFEVNEAFAAQAVYCARELGLDPEKLNVNGGAIALGHPLGCTGARQVATLLHELERRGGRYGVISMCVGGGMGAAGLIELAN
jgi:acetyl-CoA acyltransferase